MPRFFILALLNAALSFCASAQNALPVRFAQDPGRNTQIGIFPRGGIIYVSANDIATVFRMTATASADVKKIELQNTAYHIRLTADNPFVVVTDQRENANMLQMPVSVFYGANSYFVPIEAFIPILKIIVGDEITCNKSVLLVGHTQTSHAFDVTGLSVEEKSNGYLIRIRCTRKLPDFESWLKQIGNDTWMYITLANARADVNTLRSTPATGIVKQILVFQSPTSVQLTLRLKGKIDNSEVIPADGSDDILVAVSPPGTPDAAVKKPKDNEPDLDRERQKWKLDVVVLDAGHGGDDPGAIGVTKTKEKDITLSITQKLGKLIGKNLKDVDVVYTRKTDTFVELYRRGQIANEHGGKLFISIHCNAMPHKPNPNNGFEIYLLRPGKTENALRIAERENEVVKLEQGYEKRYQKLTEENFILLSMAQSAYVKYSEKFSAILSQEFSKNLDIVNGGIKQAGFYVLVGASMPNVLVETGYLSNRHDEKILKSAKGQQQIAEAIFRAVKKYKAEYEKSLSEGATAGSGTR